MYFGVVYDFSVHMESTLEYKRKHTHTPTRSPTSIPQLHMPCHAVTYQFDWHAFQSTWSALERYSNHNAGVNTNSSWFCFVYSICFGWRFMRFLINCVLHNCWDNKFRHDFFPIFFSLEFLLVISLSFLNFRWFFFFISSNLFPISGFNISNIRMQKRCQRQSRVSSCHFISVDGKTSKQNLEQIWIQFNWIINEK